MSKNNVKKIATEYTEKDANFLLCCAHYMNLTQSRGLRGEKSQIVKPAMKKN